MAANTAAATGTVAVRAVVSLGIAAAYVLASIVSFVVWVLTRLGEAVLYLAEMANRIKPEPGERPSLRQSFDPSSLPYPNPMGGGMPAAVPEPPMPTTTAAYSPPGIGRGSYAPRGFRAAACAASSSRAASAADWRTSRRIRDGSGGGVRGRAAA